MARAEENDELASRHHVRFTMRVGMHTGTVVVGASSGDEAAAFGDVPNVAARVQALAAPDTVVITAAVHRLVSGLFLVEDRGAQTLEGVPEPVGLFRIVQPSGVRSKLAAAAAARGLTPFVGRDHERRLLRERFEQACEGDGQVVLLVGEPGIGKSRLAQVLREDLAGTPHTWLESGGLPYFASTPFYAVRELLRQALAWEVVGPPEMRVEALARALETAGLKPTEAVPLVAPLLDLPVSEGYPPLLASPEVARPRLLATLAAWAFGTARLQPMVILVEDLQWVDPSTLDLQQLLVEQAAKAPLLLLYTARPEFRGPWPRRAHHTQLTLSRLPRRHTREMVVQAAARAALPVEVIEAVVARTDGVPLFVEELTKAAVEAGPAAREIPATLQDSLMARLDRLGRAKEIAQVGAVCGREFSSALLHAVLPLPKAELEAALRKPCDGELVYARGLPPDASYLFKHALVREAAYSSLLKSRRRELHGRVAPALAEQFPVVVDAQPELLAHHYTEAGEAKSAVSAWQRAGERALNYGAEELR